MWNKIVLTFSSACYSKVYLQLTFFHLPFCHRMLCVYMFLLLTLGRKGLASLQDKQTDFGLKLFFQLSQDSLDRNVAVSPYGAASVLSMAQLGAAGNTRKVLRAALGFSLQGESNGDTLGILFGVKIVRKKLLQRNNIPHLIKCSSSIHEHTYGECFCFVFFL